MLDHRNHGFAAILLATAAVAGCGGPQCANKAFFGLPSPDGASIAFIFHRSCSTKEELTTNVSVLDFHSPLRNEAGNVLAVDKDQPVRVAWLGPQKLLVTGFADPAIRRSEKIGSIAIEFRPADSGAAGNAK